MDSVQIVLALLDATGSIGIAILIWRSIVADNERGELMNLLKTNADWLRTIFVKLLDRTGGHED